MEVPESLTDLDRPLNCRFRAALVAGFGENHRLNARYVSPLVRRIFLKIIFHESRRFIGSPKPKKYICNVPIDKCRTRIARYRLKGGECLLVSPPIGVNHTEPKSSKRVVRVDRHGLIQ